MKTIFFFILLVAFPLFSLADFYSAKKAYELQQAKKAVILDVRTPGETETGVAKGATLLPLAKLEKEGPELEELLKAIPKDKTIAVYCAVGGRSETAKAILLKKGYKVENIGGLRDWKGANLPVEIPGQ